MTKRIALPLWKVALARDNDERHYYIYAETVAEALAMAHEDWNEEFPGVQTTYSKVEERVR